MPLTTCLAATQVRWLAFALLVFPTSAYLASCACSGVTNAPFGSALKRYNSQKDDRLSNAPSLSQLIVFVVAVGIVGLIHSAFTVASRRRALDASPQSSFFVRLPTGRSATLSIHASLNTSLDSLLASLLSHHNYRTHPTTIARVHRRDPLPTIVLDLHRLSSTLTALGIVADCEIRFNCRLLGGNGDDDDDYFAEDDDEWFASAEVTALLLGGAAEPTAGPVASTSATPSLPTTQTPTVGADEAAAPSSSPRQVTLPSKKALLAAGRKKRKAERKAALEKVAAAAVVPKRLGRPPGSGKNGAAALKDPGMEKRGPGRPPDTPEVVARKAKEREDKAAAEAEEAAKEAEMKELEREEWLLEIERKAAAAEKEDPERWATLTTMRQNNLTRPSRFTGQTTLFGMNTRVPPTTSTAARGLAASSSTGSRAVNPSSTLVQADGQSGASTQTTPPDAPSRAPSPVPYPPGPASAPPPPRPSSFDFAQEDGLDGGDDVDDLQDGAGVGEDDGDDDDDEGGHGGGGPPPAPRQGRWVHPEWLQEDYAKHKDWITSTRVRLTGLTALHRRPNSSSDLTLLGTGSFWLPQPLSFHLLTAPQIPHPSKLYLPAWFYWDPAPLVQGGIRCPLCSAPKMGRKGFIHRPRRVCGMEGSIYLIGCRYSCTGCSRSVVSWHQGILAQLPRDLRGAFPFVLSHRGGCTTQVLQNLRLLASQGLGTKQFSAHLRLLHDAAHDRKRRDYYEAIRRKHAGDIQDGRKPLVPYPEFGHLGDSERNAGYIPGPTWFAERYNLYIETHEAEMDQHTSTLCCDIGAEDESHKMPAAIAQIDGTRPFIGLFTLTNRYNEIKIMSLVPTKAHSQFALALDGMRMDLEAFGHEPVQYMYTDNVIGDKTKLEHHFPSLKIGVEGAPSSSRWAHLPRFDSKFTISTCNTVNEINDLMRLLGEHITDDTGGDDGQVLGFDIEWNVDAERAPNGQIIRSTRGESTAIVTIADSITKRAHILQVASLFRSKTLPGSLYHFLFNPRLKKAGVGVLADLNLVKQDFVALGRVQGDRSASVKGAAELGKLAGEAGLKERSLEDLVGVVLKRRLEKPDGVRISTAWEAAELSAEQKDYAALDAIAGLQVYQRLVEIIKSRPLPPQSPIPSNMLRPGLPVLLVAGATRIALATVQLLPSPASTRPFSHEGINVTKTRVLVTVTHVLTPGAFATEHAGSKVNGQRPSPPTLASFGPAPFDLVVKLNQLRTSHAIPAAEGDDELEEDASTLETISSTEAATMDEEGAAEMTQVSAEELRAWDQPDEWTAGGDATTLEEEDDLTSTSLDEAIQAQLRDAYKAYRIPQPPPSIHRLYSRVLLDIWHLMDRIYIPKRHGCRASFMRAFSNILFVFHPEDVKLLTARFVLAGSTFEHEFSRNRKYVLARCRRSVPPPEQLLPLLINLFETYGPMKDAKSGRPLFNDDAVKASKGVLDMVKAGFVSDPPGIQLYTVIKQCGGPKGDLRDGVQVYRCCRGTNMTEGGVHQNLRRRFPKAGISIRHAAARLADYRLIHNLVVGTYNRTGVVYAHHYDIWLLNDLQELEEATAGWIEGPQLEEWVNGRLFHQPRRSYAILPIPSDVTDALRLLPFDPALVLPPNPSSRALSVSARTASTKRSSTPLHNYLASKQGTKFAVLHLHTQQERAVFVELLRDEFLSKMKDTQRWPEMARRWNDRANGREIFYKLPEHLSAYYSTWVTRSNEKMTLQRNADKLNTLNLAVKDDSRRKTIAPPAPPRPKLPLAASLTVARVVTTSASERLAAHPITRTVEDSGAQAGPSANGQAVAKRVRGHAEVQEEGEEDGEEEEEEEPSRVRRCKMCKETDTMCSSKGFKNHCQGRCIWCGCYGEWKEGGPEGEQRCPGPIKKHSRSKGCPLAPQESKKGRKRSKK